MLHDVIAAGVRPDLSKIDDAEITALISSYFDRGCCDQSLSGGRISPAQESCIIADVFFKDCLGNPPHTYSRLVQCIDCSTNGQPEGACPQLFKVPGASRLVEDDLSCTVCG